MILIPSKAFAVVSHLVFLHILAMSTAASICTVNAASPPSPPTHLSVGMILFNGFAVLDVFGPLEYLNILSVKNNISLSLIANNLDPVSSTTPLLPAFANSVGESIVPTHTFDNAPPLDVLIVPGGVGTRPIFFNDTNETLLQFIQSRAVPSTKLSFLLSVCTGASLLAKAGALDGKRATTNKAAYKSITSSPFAKNVKWVPKARWVEDGNTITSSGVTAGIDMMVFWISKIYGLETAVKISNTLEYEPHFDPSYDPFSDIFNVTGNA
ncbi:hypothetical protein HDU97_007887 [Phlyctochytrium planicorne]|nr:hypothetical protein HDU97_007887 [Phlyctochytrium planicorne]